MKFLFHLLVVLGLALGARAEELLPGVKRILFLGDSITYGGHYVDLFETFLATQYPERKIEVINCGLPSETVSGLSETGHAGGKFARPDLHERLDRVLALVKPDLVVACYGMNCGIYLPLDEERFGRFQQGIEKLRDKVRGAGAEIIHLTPAVFDAVPLQGKLKPADTVKDGEQYEGYDGVLTRYSAWLMEQKSKGWRVVDTHQAMRTVLDAKRAMDPAYKFAGDGVHPNADGNRAMAEALIRELAPEKASGFSAWLDGAGQSETGKKLQRLVHERGRVLADTFLTTAGHLRPGMAKGVSLEEAKAKAEALTQEISDLVKAGVQ